MFLDLHPDQCAPELMGGVDADMDDLSDLCEYQLAFNFRPLLRSAYNDDTRGEPYWAARPENGTVRIFYALAYYRDWGPADVQPVSPCQAVTNWNLFASWFGVSREFYCNMHEGDSEFLVAEVQYEADTQHWVLNRMFLSAHYRTDGNQSRWVPANELEYPEVDSWYPRVFVAIGKHANYESVSQCEGTAYAAYIIPYQKDVCSYLSIKEIRPYISIYNNLGSRAYPIDDNPINSQGDVYGCRVSTGAFAGNGQQECFWKTSQSFRGWQSYSGVTGYGLQLSDFDF